MKSTEFGEIILSEQDIVQGLYSGKITDLNNLNIDNLKLIEQFNFARKQNADVFQDLKSFQNLYTSVKLFDKSNQSNWFMPEDYCTNLVEFLYDQCTTKEQQTRVDQELTLFIQHNMFDLLFYLKYLVDTMREHNVVWGVGRGSSVASYVLYLIGIHKVDSIKYDLDIHEFLK